MQSLTYEWANAASTYDPEAPRGPSLLLELDIKDAQAVFTRHVAGMLRSLDMRYCFGRNAFLSLTADSSLPQLENMFTDITLTTNDCRDFDTIIAVDISPLAEVCGEKPMHTFLTGIQEAARYAAILFLVRPEVIRSQRDTDRLIREITRTFAGHLQIVKFSQHSIYKVNKIVLDCIDACKITVENQDAVQAAMEQLQISCEECKISKEHTTNNPANDTQKGVL